MTEYPQVLTHKLKETDYFARQTEQEKQRISDWLLVNGFINVVEGEYESERIFDVAPGSTQTIFQGS